jgi:hypothetical protein
MINLINSVGKFIFNFLCCWDKKTISGIFYFKHCVQIIGLAIANKFFWEWIYEIDLIVSNESILSGIEILSASCATFLLVTFIISSLKRIADIQWPRWMIIFLFVPFLNLIFLFILFLKDGPLETEHL